MALCIRELDQLGATGLAQCAELVWQLLGRAEKRQVDNAEVALAHTIGLGLPPPSRTTSRPSAIAPQSLMNPKVVTAWSR